MPSPPSLPCAFRRGFTLIEVLVVIGIIAVLIAILLPVLSSANRAARLVKVRADLIQIGLALDFYQKDHDGQLPPTRFSCASRTDFELPIELIERDYLPGRQENALQKVDYQDAFQPQDTYRYRAPGAAIVNEFTLIPNGGRLWVPDDYPNLRLEPGKYYDDPLKTPVRFAVWSVGPDLGSPKFATNPGRAPLPRRFWSGGSNDTGVIALWQDEGGDFYESR